MNKPASLRKALGDALPDLRRDPDKLLVFSDAGAILSVNTQSLSFAYRYDLNLILTDFAGDPNLVMLAVLGWVKVNQRDLLENPDKRADGISFEVDHINHKTCDLSIKLSLTEDVKVVVDENGARTITYVPEPVPEWELSGLAGE